MGFDDRQVFFSEIAKALKEIADLLDDNGGSKSTIDILEEVFRPGDYVKEKNRYPRVRLMR